MLIAFQTKTGEARFNVVDGPKPDINTLINDFKQFGQLSRIPGVEVAVTKADRERAPDMLIQHKTLDLTDKPAGSVSVKPTKKKLGRSVRPV